MMADGIRAPETRGVVCHLIASGFAGGPEKQIIESSALLASRGWSMVVGSFRERRPSVEVTDRAGERGLPTFLIDTRSPFSPGAVRQLARWQAHFHVDLLVTHGYKANLIGYLANRRAKVVQIPMVRGYTAEDWKVRIYEMADTWLLRRFSRVLCVSAATRDLLERRGVPRERITVVRNAVGSDAPVSRVDLRREFDLPPGGKVLVAAGRLSPEKGHRDLLIAIALLREGGSPVSLVIFGAGREGPALERRIAEADLSGCVRMAGFRENIEGYLAGADLVVNPSHSEGLPNVVLESLALGKPVVATAVGGVGEVVIHRRTGWLAPPRDPRALADAIRAALSDDAEARAVAERGRALVSGSFSFRNQSEQLAEILTDALLGSRGSDS